MKIFWKVTALTAAMIPAMAMAMGGASGPKTTYEVQGHLGEIVMNPYEVAPLTAVIRNGGYQIEDATVTILPKPNGQTISYKVSPRLLLIHGGIPVFGLYADYVNSVKVDYTRVFNGKKEKFSDTYKIYASPLYAEASGLLNERSALPKVRPVKVDPKFQDRLYMLKNAQDLAGKASHAVWNNPVGGALEWNFYPQIGIVDTQGEYRWYLFVNPIYNLDSLYWGGDMMGFRQNADGAFSWGYGQRYAKYDLMGREIFNRRLPVAYNDFSHSLDPAQNGHFFLRVASSNVKLANGQNVRTVRDVITEVDQNGYVVDEFRLFDILDPYRADVIKMPHRSRTSANAVRRSFFRGIRSAQPSTAGGFSQRSHLVQNRLDGHAEIRVPILPMTRHDAVMGLRDEAHQFPNFRPLFVSNVARNVVIPRRPMPSQQHRLNVAASQQRLNIVETKIERYSLPLHKLRQAVRRVTQEFRLIRVQHIPFLPVHQLPGGRSVGRIARDNLVSNQVADRLRFPVFFQVPTTCQQKVHLGLQGFRINFSKVRIVTKIRYLAHAV